MGANAQHTVGDLVVPAVDQRIIVETVKLKEVIKGGSLPSLPSHS